MRHYEKPIMVKSTKKNFDSLVKNMQDDDYFKAAIFALDSGALDKDRTKFIYWSMINWNIYSANRKF